MTKHEIQVANKTNKCIKFQQCGNTAIPGQRTCVFCQKYKLSPRRQREIRQNSINLSKIDRNYIKNSNLKTIDRSKQPLFTMSTEWINKHRTKNGAWTAAQVEAIGLKFNQLSKGWTRKLAGHKITYTQKKLFEDGKHIYAKKRKQLNKLAEQDLEKLLEPISPN